jgi:NAD(P)-dependent dehydrogenase (short-subunit alcohol dehydrogenase family)
VQDLAGKVAVVTGAGSGIGRSLVGAFAAHGMRVVAADIEAEALHDTESRFGDVVVSVRTDVTSRDEVEHLAARAYDAFGAVDVLCNNAGVFQGGLLWECTDADFQWTLGVNLWGILHGIRAFVPRMLAAGNDAHIVNTISMAGLASTPFSGPYDVSKFAAMAATECLAHDLATIGAPIKVSAVCPGLVDTGIARSRRNRPAELTTEQHDGGAFVEQALADGTAGSMSPDAVAALVVEAIHEERFLVPTRPSYAQQLTDRAEDLVARQVPRSPAFD